ncbi:MAG: substrate-binding domain-containing protein [Bacteroidetes bacterium]|nr:substrate-binding domain-containing protein [Bacteroidota bacterium]
MESSDLIGQLKKLKSKSFYLFLGLFLAFQSCGGPNDIKNVNSPTTGKIKILVDETFKPIIESEIDVFQSIYKYAEITPIYKTETESLNELFNDSTDLVIVSRKLSAKEKKFFEDKKMYPKETKIAVDGVALIVNNNNSDTLISWGMLKKILTGEITKWKELNPKSKLNDLKVVFDNKNSSTVRYAIDSICKEKPLSTKLQALSYNADVVDFVSKNENAIGIIGVSWVSNKQDSSSLSFLNKIKVMGVSSEADATPENSYQPYQAYIAQKQYPLTRCIYVINAEGMSGLASGFAAFLASDRGQRIILRSGILPATQPIRIVELNKNNPE